MRLRMAGYEEFYLNKTILITGGAGAIGHNLVNALLPIVKKIVIIDDLSSGFADNVPNDKKIHFLNGSVLDNTMLGSAFLYPIDIVFHLAANFANQNSVDHPQKDLLVNSLGTLKLLEKCTEKRISKFIYSSSSCIYGNMESRIDESRVNSKLDTPYAISKLSGEYYSFFFYHHYKLPVTILRYFNSYGEGEHPGKYRNVVPNFFKLALEKNPLPITGTGNETRDFTYVGDTVRGTLLIAASKASDGKVFNIGSGRETKIIDIANQINMITGNDKGVVYKDARSWDSVKKRCANITKAKELGYNPSTSLSDGLVKTYAWIKNKVKHE